MTGPLQQRDAILSALGRLLAWPEIVRSPQLGRFLDYIVQQTLAGEGQAIKAYSIAVDVFGRPHDFDPQADPIVRVQARRLRGLLDEYYRGPGLEEPLQIRLPVGRYVPDFITVDVKDKVEPVPAIVEPVPSVASGGPAQRKGVTLSWYVLAVIAVGTAMAAYALSTWGPRQQMAAAAAGSLQRPTVNIVEFQDLSGQTRPSPQVAGLAIELVTDLGQFDTITVVYRPPGAAVEAAETLPANDFVLTGVARPDGDLVQYSAILTESRSGSVVWNHTLAVAAAEAALPAVLDRVSQSFSLILGSPRGPLHAPARKLLDSTADAQVETNLYLCRVLFDRYRETGAGADGSRASLCFGRLSEMDKQNSSVLAATASLIAEGSPPVGDPSPGDRFRLAGISMERAMQLDPLSGFVWEQHARWNEGQGARVAAQSDFASAVQLNPASADALAGFARLLAFAGQLDEAENMGREAAERSPAPPPWYFVVPTLLALRDGDFAAAVTHAETYALADRELGSVLALVAGQRLANSDVVNRYLPQVLDIAAFRANGVLPRLRERIADDRLIDDIRTALTEAGVPWTALTRPF